MLRARAQNHGKNPAWTSYEKLRAVIEKRMFSSTEDLLPVISFNAKASKRGAEKHHEFVQRMVAKVTPTSRCACWPSGTCGRGRLHEFRFEPVPAWDFPDPGPHGRRGNRSFPPPLAREARVGTGDGPPMSQFVDRRLRQEPQRRKPAAFPAPFQRADPQGGVQGHRRAQGRRPGTRREISIPSKDMTNRFFHHGPGGGAASSTPATEEFVTGDRVDRPPGGQGGGGGQASPDGEGMDEFTFELTREEFMDFFFEDLALPDLVKKQLLAIPR